MIESTRQCLFTLNVSLIVVAAVNYIYRVSESLEGYKLSPSMNQILCYKIVGSEVDLALNMGGCKGD